MRPRVSGNEIIITIPDANDFMAWAERIAQIIEFNGKLIEKSGGYRFMIGTGNDWWLDRGDEPTEIKIAYRYGYRDGFMKKYREALILILGLERCNPPNE